MERFPSPCSTRFAMRNFSFLLILSSVAFAGCVDRPEVSPDFYGTVVGSLPSIKEAEEPFPFPHAAEVDHSSCVFDEEDFF